MFGKFAKLFNRKLSNIKFMNYLQNISIHIRFVSVIEGSIYSDVYNKIA